MCVSNKLAANLTLNFYTAVISLLMAFSYTVSEKVIADSTGVDQNHGLSSLASWDRVSVDAKAQMIPIVLLVEQRLCTYCQRAKAERLRPASRSNKYQGRAIFVSLATDTDEPPIEHNGATISTFEFAESYGASFTPTVLFLDYLGNEVQQRMVGYSASSTESAIFETRLSNAITAVSQTN